MKRGLATIIAVSLMILPYSVLAGSAVCRWSGLDWSQLTKSQRTSWSSLGWSQATWDADRAPASDGKDWKELRAGERAAATALGYNASTWGVACSKTSNKSSMQHKPVKAEKADKSDLEDQLENAMSFATGD